MENKFAWMHSLNRVSAAITEQICHDFNLMKQETTHLKREVSSARMLEKRMYFRTQIYYDVSKGASDRNLMFLYADSISH